MLEALGAGSFVEEGIREILAPRISHSMLNMDSNDDVNLIAIDNDGQRLNTICTLEVKVLWRH